VLLPTGPADASQGANDLAEFNYLTNAADMERAGAHLCRDLLPRLYRLPPALVSMVDAALWWLRQQLIAGKTLQDNAQTVRSAFTLVAHLAVKGAPPTGCAMEALNHWLITERARLAADVLAAWNEGALDGAAMLAQRAPLYMLDCARTAASPPLPGLRAAAKWNVVSYRQSRKALVDLRLATMPSTFTLERNAVLPCWRSAAAVMLELAVRLGLARRGF
jgi:hypothetical protein